MEPPLAIAIYLLALISAVRTNPTDGSCTVTEHDIAAIKSAVHKASRAAVGEIVLDQTLIDKCPVLKNITDGLKSVATEIAQLRDSSVGADQVEQLKQNFEEQVQEIVKSQDIFEKQFGAQATKEHGEMADRMTALQVKVAELQQQIANQTARMYEHMAELIFQQLQINSTDSIRSYTKQIIDQKLEQLMEKLETNYRVYLGALRYLNHMNDQDLIDKVFDGILKRLDEMKLDSNKDLENGKYVLVNLLCWTVNNRFLSRKYHARRFELFDIALKFYPNLDNKAENEADVRSRQYCQANFPVNVVTWFAVSWKRG